MVTPPHWLNGALREADLVPQGDEVLATHTPAAWAAIRPILDQMPVGRIQTEAGCSVRETRYLKSGEPHLEGDRYSRMITSCARYSGEMLEQIHAPFIPNEDIPATRLYAHMQIRG